MSVRRARNIFKRTVANVIQTFARDGQVPEFIGSAVRSPLEATTRRYVIDEILRDLGWNIGSLEKQVVEEARTKGETTLFLDYLGLESKVPRIIVEAKAWGKPIVSASAAGLSAQLGPAPSLSQIVAAGVSHYKSGGEKTKSPVTAEWFEWLSKLTDYVVAVHKESGHAVRRVAITSGRWTVIFENPEQAFLGSDPSDSSQIHIFDQDQMIDESDWIFDLISRQALITTIDRPIEPSQVSSLISTNDVSKIFRGTWIVQQSLGSRLAPYPEITVYPVIIVLSKSGELVIVQHHEASRTTLPLSNKLGAHLVDVEGGSEAILAAVNSALNSNFAPSPLTDFPGFDSENPTASAVSFVRSLDFPDEFVVATGQNLHYLRAASTKPDCLGHSWAKCHELSLGQGASPIVKASFDPSSFSVSGDEHHCAHRVVHNQRRPDRCQIQVFEQYLCCKACIFQGFCWTQDELAGLPCGKDMPSGLPETVLA